jgi:hypothetical protein
MAANKTSSKGRKTSTPKKKASARQNAAERMSRVSRVGETRSVPHGNKLPSQSRFPGETPLTGEDRPAMRAGHKQHGYEQDARPTRTRVTADTKPDLRAPTVKRRPGAMR